MEISTVVGATIGMVEASWLSKKFYRVTKQKLGVRVSMVASGVLASGFVSAVSGTSSFGFGARQIAILWAGALGGVAGSFEKEWFDIYATIFSTGIGYSMGVFQLPVVDAAAACLSAFAVGRLAQYFKSF